MWNYSLETEIKIQQKKIIYSRKEQENLSEVSMSFKDASNIKLFLLLSRRESPYRSTSFLILSNKDSKLARADLTLFIISR